MSGKSVTSTRHTNTPSWKITRLCHCLAKKQYWKLLLRNHSWESCRSKSFVVLVPHSVRHCSNYRPTEGFQVEAFIHCDWEKTSFLSPCSSRRIRKSPCFRNFCCITLKQSTGNIIIDELKWDVNRLIPN